ncbi:arp2/3 complex-activating protein rickA-like isoform X1 [Sebastes umbrosus]|uniref:arp2/3 complex-activating protein rickA-like isoform X1 n=1 Tax=Sebastes umbrosus TaxID=72105 RepID=UPI00189DB955|nr:arp2/3 complex-activating protein rickA-like isoform X1 [Sebastes umbrosus]
MAFLEGSRGIYGPIRFLFDTPIYKRALKICWNITSYKIHTALLRELMRLQQEQQIPSHVTAEDMYNLIYERSKKSLRESLWKFELERYDDENVKSLLTLLYAVNVSNKMRDMEFEACFLLNNPEALPPMYQGPKILRVAEKCAETLRQKQEEAPSSRLGPQEVILEVVPKVLQGFWKHPPTLLIMPSQKLSQMSVGVTKAVSDRVSYALNAEHRATFSRSTRDDMVLSILTEIRQSHPHDVLVERISSFSSVLLKEIVNVAARKICGMFWPQSPKVPAHLTPPPEPPVPTPVQEAETEEPETDSAASPTPPAEPPSTTDVEAREDGNLKTTRELDSAVTPAPLLLTPPAEPEIAVQDVRTTIIPTEQPTISPEINSADVSPPPAPRTSPSEPLTDVQDREDTNDETTPTTEPASSVVPPTPPQEPVVIVEVSEEVERAQGFFSWLFQRLCCCFK